MDDYPDNADSDGPVLYCLDRSATIRPMEQAGVSDISDRPKTVNDLPAHYRWADALEIGKKYTHPTKGFTVDASAANVKKIERDFQRLIGHKVAVPYVADHSLRAKDSMGTVIATRRKDGWMQVLLQILGDDSLNITRKNKISIGLKRNMRDGAGNVYELGIEHVAATPIPVVNGQSNELFAASRDADGEAVFLLSSAPITTRKVADMSKTTLSDAHKKACMAHLAEHAKGEPGVKPEMEDDDAMGAMLTVAGKHARDLDRLKAMNAKTLSRAGVEIDWSDPQAMLDSFNANLSRIENDNRTLSLSRSSGVQTDPEVIHERGLRIRANASRLIGAFTPANVAKICDAIAGTPESPNTLALSRSEGDSDCLAGKLIDVLAECSPAPRTGDFPGQYNLSRATPQSGQQEQVVEAVSPYTGKKIPVPAS